MTSLEVNPSMRLKTVIIIASVILVVAGGSVLAYQIWWQTKGVELVASLGDGTRFGATGDREACVTEAVLRVKRGTGLIGFTDQVKNQLFLEECLKAAAPVAGFCVGVPARSDATASSAWRADMGKKYGLEGTLRQGLVQEIQDFCNADAGQH